MKTITSTKFGVLAAAGLVLAVDRAKDQAHGNGELPEAKIPETKIQGVWELKFPDGSRQLKFIIDGMWTVTRGSPGDGKVIVHLGGRYTFDGKTYVETVEYSNGSTANLVGKRLTFEVSVKGDTYRQVGIGNPYTEDWTRVKKE